jgi:hypothetical protein
MTQRAVGIAVVAVGVATNLGGVFGIAGERSMFLFAAGVAILISGAVVLVYAGRNVAMVPPHFSVIAIAAIGAALHAYESLWQAAGGPSLGFLFWGLTPYFLCLFVAMSSKSPAPAAVGAAIALLFDLLAHYRVFVRPTSSTAALALVVTPLWNTLAFAPLGILVTWLTLRGRAQLSEPAA